jgi:hypothetical protein
LVTSAQSEVKNELHFSLDGDEALGVTDAVVVRFPGELVGFLLLDKSPDLIGLNVRHWNVYDEPAHELFAPLAGEYQKFRDRVSVDVRDALRAAEGVAFNQEPESQHDAMLGEIATFQDRLVGFGVRLVALGAPEAAQAIPVLAEALAFHAARFASHCNFDLCRALHNSILQLSLVVCQA